MTPEEKFDPKIVGFFCTWCSYTAADLAGTQRLEVQPSIHIIRMLCSGRMDPLILIRALLRGADGVLLGGCHPGDCHYQVGNYHARRRFVMINRILESLSFDPQRARMAWMGASEGERVSSVVEEFTETVSGLGPNPTKDEIFL